MHSVMHDCVSFPDASNAFATSSCVSEGKAYLLLLDYYYYSKPLEMHVCILEMFHMCIWRSMFVSTKIPVVYLEHACVSIWKFIMMDLEMHVCIWRCISYT